MKNNFRKRVNELWKILEKKSISSAVFLCSAPIFDASIQYLTGFRQMRESAFSCLIFSKGKSVLVVSALDYDQAVVESEADEIIQIKKARLSDIIKEKNGKGKIGVNESLMTLLLAKRIGIGKLTGIEDDVLKLRSIKDSWEIEQIKKSCAIASHGVHIVEKELPKARTCKELSITLESELLRKADEMAFPTLMTSGRRGLWVHPYPAAADEKIENMGLIDFGVRINGYNSDVTVPFVKGVLSGKQKIILRTVKEAYARAVESLEIGAEAHKVFEAAEKVIKRNGFEFKHSLGHGIGLDVHEYPNLSPKPVEKKLLKTWKPTILKENMIFTIEPGVYEKFGGLRLENDFLMTRRGPRILTNARVLEL